MSDMGKREFDDGNVVLTINEHESDDSKLVVSVKGKKTYSLAADEDAAWELYKLITSVLYAVYPHNHERDKKKVV